MPFIPNNDALQQQLNAAIDPQRFAGVFDAMMQARQYGEAQSADLLKTLIAMNPALAPIVLQQHPEVFQPGAGRRTRGILPTPRDMQRDAILRAFQEAQKSISPELSRFKPQELAEMPGRALTLLGGADNFARIPAERRAPALKAALATITGAGTPKGDAAIESLANLFPAPKDEVADRVREEVDKRKTAQDFYTSNAAALGFVGKDGKPDLVAARRAALNLPDEELLGLQKAKANGDLLQQAIQRRVSEVQIDLDKARIADIKVRGETEAVGASVDNATRNKIADFAEAYHHSQMVLAQARRFNFPGGVLEGRINNLIGDTDYADYNAQLQSLTSKITHALAGSNQTPAEIERISAFVPNGFTNTTKTVSGLTEIARSMKTQGEAYLDALARDPKVSQDQVRALRKMFAPLDLEAARRAAQMKAAGFTVDEQGNIIVPAAPGSPNGSSE